MYGSVWRGFLIGVSLGVLVVAGACTSMDLGAAGMGGSSLRVMREALKSGYENSTGGRHEKRFELGEDPSVMA